MYNTIVNDNEILFSRKGELIRLTSCGNNAIRFQGFPDCKVIDTDYTLMPAQADCQIVEEERSVSMLCGKLKATVERNGKVTYYVNDKKILEEKPELTFNDGFRNYTNKGSGLWSARVTFEPIDNEHFFGMGHSWDNQFDLKGSSICRQRVLQNFQTTEAVGQVIVARLLTTLLLQALRKKLAQLLRI